MVDENDDTAPRIGIYRGNVDDQMEADMKSALQGLKRLLNKSSATVTTVKGPKQVEAARAAHAPIQGYEARLSLGDEYTRNKAKLSKNLREYLKDSASITSPEYDNARRMANHGRKACHSLFDNCDVLLMPSAPGTAPRTLKSTGNSIFNQLWTLMGLPCVNVPGLTGENGLPLGVQVVAPFGKDKRALQAAHWIEIQLEKAR